MMSVNRTIQRLTKPSPRRQVVISATNAFMAHWLAPRLADFNLRHPDIDLDLHASDRPIEMGSDQADIAIRYGRGAYPGLHSVILFSDSFAPLASPALVDTDLTDESRPLIDFRWTHEHPLNPTWPAWFTVADLPWLPQRVQLRFSDEGHAIQSALAGQGVALLSIELLADELRAGRLVRLRGAAIPGHTYHLVSNAGHTPESHVLAAWNWLRAQGSSGTG